MKKSNLGKGNQNSRLVPGLISAGMHLPYGSFVGIGLGGVMILDMKDANVQDLEFGEGKSELDWLNLIRQVSAGCDTKYHITLEQVAREILMSETTFDLSRYDLHLSASGARSAMVSVIDRVTTKDKSFVAYSSPNWVFDKIVSHTQNAHPLPFFANDSRTFVDNFTRLKNLDQVAAVILVDPSNPLGYRLTREDVREIEGACEKYGIVPIFDDVFRGMQRKGQRHSASEYSTGSVVVETTSKRFGERGLGVTWTLVPKDLVKGHNLDSLNSDLRCPGCYGVAAIITQALYNTDYGEKVRRKLRLNSLAFRRGLLDSLQGTEDRGRFVKAFDAMPLFVYYLPQSCKGMNLEQLEILATISGTVPGFYFTKTSGSELGDNERALANSYLRVCPTKETTLRSYFSGEMIGLFLRDKKWEEKVIVPCK